MPVFVQLPKRHDRYCCLGSRYTSLFTVVILVMRQSSGLPYMCLYYNYFLFTLSHINAVQNDAKVHVYAL